MPDTPDAVTSDHGWDLKKDADRLEPIIKQLKNLGIRVSLFIDADVSVVKMAGQLDADAPSSSAP